MGLSHTISDINGEFNQKSQIFPTPVYLTTPLSGVPLELGNTGWPQETWMTELPGRERSSTISLAIWIQYMNVIDRQMDSYWLTSTSVTR